MTQGEVFRVADQNRLARLILGERPSAKLPARVQEAIERQQHQSERLIGWVQLVLGLVFLSLWAASPKPEPMPRIEPVPWALGFYLAFTVLRLATAYRGRLPGWFLGISVVIDMALLMVLIWSFHIKYDQPPSFYLKAPTLMYVFIFISLRALRFEPRFIVYSGLAAAAGWGLLMAYVVSSNPTDTMITRDYVAYMTSNAILVGAEIDKILSILVVTAVLAIAVLRAQRVFRRAVADQAAAEDLSRFVSKEVADRVTSADSRVEPGDGESREVTVLFTDIEGFSTVSESLSAAELARTLNDYFVAMGEAVERHHGVVLYFEGDLMLITFNAVGDDPEHAANAVRCAADIRRISQSRTFGDGRVFRTRCGLNTGPCAVGALGTASRLVFTVHGDNVNLAARLEQMNKEFATYILASEETKAAAGDGFGWRRVGETVARGRSRPTTLYTIDD